MCYVLFGRSGLRVSELCLGTMTFGAGCGWGEDQEDSRRLFGAFVKECANFLDTAHHYTIATAT